jgi:glycosyltransferase involved in cell wall biosynthesis
MRVLLTCDLYPPFIGGAERQVQLLGRELVARGHEVRVASVWHDGLPVRRLEDGVDVWRLKALMTQVPWFSSDPARRIHPPSPDPALVLRLRRMIRRWRPDVVHANGWIAYSCAAALLGDDTPLIVSVRDYGYSCPLRTLMERGRISTGPGLAKCISCASENYGLPKAIVATVGVLGNRPLLRRKLRAAHSVSRYVRSIVERDLLGPGVHDVLLRTLPDIAPNAALVLPPLSAADQEYVVRLPAEPFVLFVGALNTHKGIGPLLEAHAAMQDAPPLVMIGSVSPETPATFPDGVVVLRDMPHRVVMEAWRRCLFGVVPSIWPDPLPGVVREGMSQRKAIIGTNVGGNPDMIVDGESGLLVPPGDVPALTAAMERLVRDADLRERLGAASALSAARYTAGDVVPLYEQLYRDVIGSPAPSAVQPLDLSEPAA